MNQRKRTRRLQRIMGPVAMWRILGMTKYEPRQRTFAASWGFDFGPGPSRGVIYVHQDT